jgi:hypothetical protein
MSNFVLEKISSNGRFVDSLAPRAGTTVFGAVGVHQLINLNP